MVTNDLNNIVLVLATVIQLAGAIGWLAHNDRKRVHTSCYHLVELVRQFVDGIETCLPGWLELVDEEGKVLLPLVQTAGLSSPALISCS